MNPVSISHKNTQAKARFGCFGEFVNCLLPLEELPTLVAHHLHHFGFYTAVFPLKHTYIHISINIYSDIFDF